jgi:hypothetical protein
LENFPLLKLDRNFAIDQIVHWGVSQLEMTQVDDYVMRLFEELSIFDPKVGRLKRQVLGHIYASSFLTRNKRTPTAREDSKRYLKWIGMAIMYDPSWLFNRGMQAGIFQLIRRKKA